MRKIITLSFTILLCLTASIFAADGSKEMNSAIVAGDFAKVKALLDGGFDPNTALPDGQSPIMAAANSGNAEIVALFIKAGADGSLIANDILGGNALTGAVWSNGETHNPANTIKIIQMLLDTGMDINSGEIRDRSSDFNAGGKNWEVYVNPIWYATGSSGCSADVLEFMLKKGCNPSRAFAICEATGERQDFGIDDLSDAVKKSKTNKADRKEYNRIVKTLKNTKDNQKKAVPAVAKAPEPAPPKEQAAVKQEKKPEPVATQKPAAAPEPVAAQKPAAAPKPMPQKQKVKQAEPKQPEPVKEATEKPSVILSKTEATELLRKSAEDGNKENFYRSLVMGADINAVDPENNTPLVMAVMSKNYEMAEVLIYKGANVNVKTKGGNTPLSLSRDLGAKDIEQMLLKAGAKN